MLAGVHPVSEALRAGRRPVHRLLLRRGGVRRPALEAIVVEAQRRGVPVEELPTDDFDRAGPAGVRSQSVLLEVGPLPAVSLEDLLGKARPAPRWLVALDGVEDPQNLGAVARVAEAVGAAGLILQERRAAPLSAAASRASAGALEILPAVIVGNLPRSLETLKQRGFWVFGADAEAGEDVFEAPGRLFEGDLVLVLGAEGRGLRPGVRAVLDALLRVPLAGRVDSLNVSAAAAVLLFEWVRRGRVAARS